MHDDKQAFKSNELLDQTVAVDNKVRDIVGFVVAYLNAHAERHNLANPLARLNYYAEWHSSVVDSEHMKVFNSLSPCIYHEVIDVDTAVKVVRTLHEGLGIIEDKPPSPPNGPRFFFLLSHRRIEFK